MAVTIPERIGWAVALLAVEESDSLLEIGCGRGVAVALIAPRLTRGRMVALDRSEAAIAAARQCNPAWEASGKVSFLHAPLSGVGDGLGRFDKIFAINVNLFWTNSGRELHIVRRLLTRTGNLYLFYEPPDEARRNDIALRVTRELAGAGLVVQKTVVEEVRNAALLGLIARHESGTPV